MTLNIDTNLDEELDKVKELLKGLEEIKEKTQLIRFVSIKDFMKISGWGKETVQDLYNRPDFPSCNFGKEKKAEIHAIIKYFSVPRRR